MVDHLLKMKFSLFFLKTFNFWCYHRLNNVSDVNVRWCLWFFFCFIHQWFFLTMFVQAKKEFLHFPTKKSNSAFHSAIVCWQLWDKSEVEREREYFCDEKETERAHPRRVHSIPYYVFSTTTSVDDEAETVEGIIEWFFFFFFLCVYVCCFLWF